MEVLWDGAQSTNTCGYHWYFTAVPNPLQFILTFLVFVHFFPLFFNNSSVKRSRHVHNVACSFLLLKDYNVWSRVLQDLISLYLHTPKDFDFFVFWYLFWMMIVPLFHVLFSWALHSCQWITWAILSWRHFLYYVWQRVLHSETKGATVSSLSPQSLHNGEMFSLSMQCLIDLVLMACSCAAIIVPSVAFFKSPFLNQFHVCSSLNSVFLKNTLCRFLRFRFSLLLSNMSLFVFPFSTVPSFLTTWSIFSLLSETYTTCKQFFQSKHSLLHWSVLVHLLLFLDTVCPHHLFCGTYKQCHQLSCFSVRIFQFLLSQFNDSSTVPYNRYCSGIDSSYHISTFKMGFQDLLYSPYIFWSYLFFHFGVFYVICFQNT